MHRPDRQELASRKRIGIHYRLVVPHPNLIDPPRLGLMKGRTEGPPRAPPSHSPPPNFMLRGAPARPMEEHSATRKDRAMG